MDKGRLEPLTEKNSVLVLVDYQPHMYTGIGSGNRTEIHRSALAAATAASILKIPTILTSIWPEGNGEFVADIAGLFPNSKVIAREVPGFDAFDDNQVLDAVKKTDRKKLVISGLWTSMCMGFTALHGLREGLQVYGLMDAAGDASKEAHEFGIHRMLQAGVVPTTWMPLVTEWMHDWDNPKADELKKEVIGKFDMVLGLPS